MSPDIDLVCPARPWPPAGSTCPWTASTDNVAVVGYNVYRDAVKLNTVPVGSTSYSDTGLASGVSHTYTVTAVDAAANESGASNTWSGAAGSGALTTTYSYDPENRLTQLASGGQTIGTYAYDGAGDRVSKTAAGVTTAYTLDLASGLPQVLTETAGSAVTAYAYAGGPFELDRSGATNWYLTDTSAAGYGWSPTPPGPAPPPTPTVPSARSVPPQALCPTRSASAASGPIPSRVWSSSGPAPTTPRSAPSCSATPGASPPPTASRSMPTSIPPTIQSTRSIPVATVPTPTTTRAANNHGTDMSTAVYEAKKDASRIGQASSGAYTPPSPATRRNTERPPTPTIQKASPAPSRDCGPFGAGCFDPGQAWSNVTGTLASATGDLTRTVVTGAEDTLDVHTIGACIGPSGFIGIGGLGIGYGAQLCVMVTGKGQVGVTASVGAGTGMGITGPPGVSAGPLGILLWPICPRPAGVLRSRIAEHGVCHS